MEINLTIGQVQDCSNGSIYHYILEPSVVTEVFDEDSEINEVLQKKEYRRRRIAMFKLLQECASMSPKSKGNSQLMMIPKPSQYKPLCLTGKSLPECTGITDNDVMVIPGGNSHSGIYTGSLIYLQGLVYATGRYCEMVVQNVEHQGEFSTVKLIVHDRPNTTVLEQTNNELKQKVICLEEANNVLKDMITHLEVSRLELQDVIAQLTQKQPKDCVEETQFFNIDDERTERIDPFDVETMQTSHIECKEVQSSQEGFTQSSTNLAATAALQREKQFLHSAYGRRIMNAMRKK